MKISFTNEQMESWTAVLQSHLPLREESGAAESAPLQPVHVVYGGAHLFRADTVQKLGRLALRSLEEYAADGESLAKALGLAAGSQGPGAGEGRSERNHGTISFGAIYDRVVEKLTNEPVEDFRIDFEDGYGLRADDEEDGHAVGAAEVTAEAMAQDALPRYFGIRIKSLSPETGRRAIRTLDIYLSRLVELTGGPLPDGFVVTLPKVESEKQVKAISEICGQLESVLGLADGALWLELMVETPRALFDSFGNALLPRMLVAGQGRVRGAHFGAFDYTAACNIVASLQDLRHPICDFARAMMQALLVQTGVWLSDSVTAVMPVPVHRGEGLTDAQREENRGAVHRAWRMHYDNIRHSLANGFYQSWDLHPAQLPIRHAAVQLFFRENLSAAATRLRNFVERATQASLLGTQFDDAATAQGLLNFFAQALASKVITEAEAAEMTGISGPELRSRSFAKIMKAKKAEGVKG
jgi:citrate lyase beta subunit